MMARGSALVRRMICRGILARGVDFSGEGNYSNAAGRRNAVLAASRPHEPERDEDPSDNIDGIRKLNVLDWLLQ